MAKDKEALNFEDTALAFGHMDDVRLKRRYKLFKKIDSPFLTRIGPPLVSFALKIGLPVKGMIKRTIFDIFCGGVSLQDTQSRSQSLYAQNVLTILDYSVEGRKDSEGFDLTRDEIIRTLEQGAGDESVAFSAMKITGIANFDAMSAKQSGKNIAVRARQGLIESKERFRTICARAAELGQPLFVDAEESWIQGTIDEWTEDMMETFNKEKAIVYTTVQLYRHDRLAYLRGLIERAGEKGYILGVKLVRGAYLEKEHERAGREGYRSPMQPDKESTDRDFDAAVELCLEHIDRVAICAGTHNQESCLKATQIMQEKGIPANHPHVVFAQLLGMSDHISFNLAHHGYLAAKYLPYGPVKAVLPYLFRRAQENTSIGGQSSREVQLLRKEMVRRGMLRA